MQFRVKPPPRNTGDAKRDIEALRASICSIITELEFMFSQIDNSGQENNDSSE